MDHAMLKNFMMISSLIFSFELLQASCYDADSDDDSLSTQGAARAQLYQNSTSAASSVINLGAATAQNQGYAIGSSSSSAQTFSQRISLTSVQLQAMRRKQAAAVAVESQRIGVGTIATLHSQIDQFFIYQGKSYRAIGFDVFHKKFSDTVTFLKQEAQVDSSLSESDINKIYTGLKDNPTQRDIRKFRVLGDMPSSAEFQDNLFNIDQAKRIVLTAVREYIDENYAQVRRECIGSGLATTTSKDVWRPGCCDVQMHRSCFKQCQHNDVAHCINPFCQIGEDGRPYSLNWTSAFYAEVLEKNKALKSTKIRDMDCPVCMEPLKPVIAEAGQSSNSAQGNTKKICRREDS